MFIDGLIYAGISNNMANGIGSFWNPEVINFHKFHYLDGSVFYEHPPLMFWLESLFFRVVGDGFIVERIFCFIVLVTNATLIILIFKLFSKRNQFHLFSWLPVLLWNTFPELIQKMPANLLDSTMSVFVLLAAYFIVLGLQRKGFFYYIAGGFCIYLAFLTKGPVGLFPLIIPVIYYFVYSFKLPVRTFLPGQLFVLLSFSTIFFLVMLHDEARNFLRVYLTNQVFASLAGEREKADTFYNHFSLIIKLLRQLAPLILILGALLLANIKIKIFNHKLVFKNAIFFLVIGLTASLPIALSSKHHSFYLIPSFPFYALSVATFITDNLEFSKVTGLIPGVKIGRVIQTILYIGLGSLLIYSISIYGRLDPRERILSDLMKYKDLVPIKSEIGVCETYYNDAKFCAYHERYMMADLRNGYEESEIVVVNPGYVGDSNKLNIDFVKISADTKEFHLYRRRE